MRTLHATPDDTTRPRAAVTLAEVLVSLGILSIGVLTVATLFPLSVLRTVQATQLTNAVILRYDAEALIAAFPQLIFDPDNSDTWPDDNERYVVDPYGHVEFDGSGIEDVYGNDEAGTGVTLPNRVRYGSIHQGGTNIAAARELVVLPDSWVTYFDEVPTATDTDSVDIADGTRGELDVDDRVILFDGTGRRSVERRVTNDPSAGNLVEFAPPITFTPERVMGQTLDARYTWLLTVRRRNTGGVGGETTASVDVVVFFNRKLTVDEEQVYEASTSGQSITVDFAGAPEPVAKPGGFLLDATNLLWYRIAKVDPLGSKLRITLAETIRTPTNAVMFPQRIVDVYPIGSFSKPTP